MTLLFPSLHAWRVQSSFAASTWYSCRHTSSNWLDSSVILSLFILLHIFLLLLLNLHLTLLFYSACTFFHKAQWLPDFSIFVFDFSQFCIDDEHNASHRPSQFNSLSYFLLFVYFNLRLLYISVVSLTYVDHRCILALLQFWLCLLVGEQWSGKIVNSACLVH